MYGFCHHVNRAAPLCGCFASAALAEPASSSGTSPPDLSNNTFFSSSLLSGAMVQMMLRLVFHQDSYSSARSPAQLQHGKQKRSALHHAA